MNEIDYIELYKRIFKIIPSEQVSIAILKEMGKDKRQANIPNNKPSPKKESPASEKQKGLIQKFITNGKLPSDFNLNISKSEANRTIKQILGK